MEKNRCKKCFYYENVELNIADFDYKHKCIAKVYYKQESNPDLSATSEYQNGFHLYLDSHLSEFWKNRLICWQNISYSFLPKITLIALVISFISIGISIRSCTTADKSLKIAEKEFESKRLALWQGIINNSTELIISSRNKDIFLQNANVYFSSEIDTHKYNIASTNFVLNLNGINNNLIIKLKNIRQLNSHVNQIKNLPIVIESEYLAHGELYMDRSLYSLEYEIKIDSSNSIQNIFFKRIYFKRRLNKKEEIHEVL